MVQEEHKSKVLVLPQAVANRIAAGEVVERPAAVVKELIENSIDAGATKITVVIQDAGRTLMRVVDDGSGMNEADLKTALGRHATSKLQRFEDLESLDTFGFRGEALPAVAGVSRLEIVSRLHDAEVGTQLKISGGTIDRCDPISTSPGTSISVSALFYNVPARRKFLKSDATEFKWIAIVFRQFALSFPGISFELYRGKNKIYDLQASSAIKRIAEMFGDDIAEELIEVNLNRDWIKVTGFISPPSLTQRNRDSQYLFLNRRPITSPTLYHSIYQSCEPYFVSGGHPLYIISIETSPERFDINVHPAKKQVKFADESGVRSAVWSAVRNAITGARTPEELAPERPVAKDSGSSQENETGNGTLAPIKTPAHLKAYTPIPRQYNAPRAPILPFPVADRSEKPQEELSFTTPQDSMSSPDSLRRGIEFDHEYDHGSSQQESPRIWQAFDTYLISPLKTGLAFIDQHIAHERILYERALSAMDKVPWDSQQILFPVTISVASEDVDLILEAIPLFEAMGFAIEQFGPVDFRVMAVPAGVRISDESEMVLGIFDEYCKGISDDKDPRKLLAASFACHAAIKANQPLKPAEMQRLIEDLFRTEDPEFCPHGRPIYHVLSRKEIDKWFKR